MSFIHGLLGSTANASGAVIPLVATGGTTSTDGDYKYHEFTGSGTFEITSNPAGETFDVIIVGGGCGANSMYFGAAGGGGGGAVNWCGEVAGTIQTYTVSVGSGGAAGQNAGSASDVTNCFWDGSSYVTAIAGGGTPYNYSASYNESGSGGYAGSGGDVNGQPGGTHQNFTGGTGGNGMLASGSSWGAGTGSAGHGGGGGGGAGSSLTAAGGTGYNGVNGNSYVSTWSRYGYGGGGSAGFRHTDWIAGMSGADSGTTIKYLGSGGGGAGWSFYWGGVAGGAGGGSGYYGGGNGGAVATYSGYAVNTVNSANTDGNPIRGSGAGGGAHNYNYDKAGGSGYVIFRYLSGL